MTAQVLSVPRIGAQRPRISWVPAAASTAQGQDAVELAGSNGLVLDDWQAWALTESLGIRDDGRWAHFEVGLLVPRQNGKNNQDVSTPILTANRGWSTMGDLLPGDDVYGAGGQPTRVISCTDVFLRDDCYQVSFTDGSAYTVGADHLWHVLDKDERGGWHDRATAHLSTRFGGRRADNGRMEYRYRVRCDAVPDTPKADLPIDPYLLGYWLGDGSATAARITVGAEDLEWLRMRLLAAGARRAGWGNADAPPDGVVQSSGQAWDLAFRLDAKIRDGFESRCRRLGVWGSKHIPEIYLTASPDQRRALLAGLMDSDGSIAVTSRSPQAEFATSEPALADGFLRLARSLGIRVARKDHPVTIRGVQFRDRARFLWTPAFNPFELPRKAARWKAPVSRRHELMSITDIRRVPSVPTRCITVAAPDGIYLTGRTFTPTHNCVLEARELAGLFLLDEPLIIHTAHEFQDGPGAFPADAGRRPGQP